MGAVKAESIYLRHPPECWHLCEWDCSRQVAEIRWKIVAKNETLVFM